MITAILAWLWPRLLLLWLLSPLLLWVGWLIVSALMRADTEGKLTAVAKKIGYLLYIPAYALDIFTNVFVLTVYSGFELPKEWTVSDRLRRWVRGDYGRRTAAAWWIADNFIDPFYWVAGKFHIRPNE